jgi:exodeoxyribonuclease VII large subunit
VDEFPQNEASNSNVAISVSELNRQARRLVEGGLPRLWVEGEVSNLSRPASGHVYFSLKDSSAQLRCAWFRQRQHGPTIHLKNGDNMLIFGKVSIYEARGDYQMIVERVEDAGEGELRRRFEALKKKLQAEGLFDEDRKQPVPTMPRRIGVVTSPSGAAVRDILTVLKRRFPLVPVVIYPAAVQGDAAAAEIVSAIDSAVNREECDVLIIGRGGGSLEDMWPFNEESVARAIAGCPIPTVSAVGHEVDFTIADFVADLRAPTPSGAAEIVVPDQAEWLRIINATGNRLVALSRRYIEASAQRLDWVSRRLAQSSPAATVKRQSQWLRNLQQVLAGAMRHDLAKRRNEIERIRSRLLQQSPALRVQSNVARLQALQQRINHAAGAEILVRQNRLRIAARALNSVSPLATLERGYAIVTDVESGKVLTEAHSVEAGTTVSARLSDGVIDAVVTGTRKPDD